MAPLVKDTCFMNMEIEDPVPKSKWIPAMSIHDQFRLLLGDMKSEMQLKREYLFGKQIGQGGSSTVYKGVRRSDGKKVAIKVFDKAKLVEVRGSMNVHQQMESAVTRVRRRLNLILSEIRILKQLHHPNIVKYYEGIETSHRICIVHELVEGTDLLQFLLDNGKMDTNQVVRVSKQIVHALRYIHGKEMYHRDIKLENILVNKDMQVKLIDFGLATNLAEKDSKRLHDICGTPLYCSPEMLFMTKSTKKIGYDGAPADMWSLGVVMYALATATAPFNDATIQTLIVAMKEEDVLYPNELGEDMTSLIQRLLHQDPTRRATSSDVHKTLIGM